MKSIKKLLASVFCLALCASMFAAPMAYAETGTYVFDDQGVLSSSDFSALEAKGAEYAAQYNMGVYLLVTDTMGSSNPSSSERNEFARSYYNSHSLGVGSGKDGIIFVIAVKSRDYVTVKHIGSSNDPFSDECVNALEDKVTEYLHDNDWAGGAKAYYDTAGEQLSYYAATGKQWTKPDLIGLILKILAAIGIPTAVAVSVISGEKNAMKTAREQTEASNYLDRDSLSLSVSNDEFVTTTLAVVPIPKKEERGGGGFSDMGGGFSGSGGGKF